MLYVQSVTLYTTLMTVMSYKIESEFQGNAPL